MVDSFAYEMDRASLQVVVMGTTYELVQGTPSAVEDSNTAQGSLIRFPDACATGNDATDWLFSTTMTPGAPDVLTP